MSTRSTSQCSLSLHNGLCACVSSFSGLLASCRIKQLLCQARSFAYAHRIRTLCLGSCEYIDGQDRTKLLNLEQKMCSIDENVVSEEQGERSEQRPVPSPCLSPGGQGRARRPHAPPLEQSSVRC